MFPLVREAIEAVGGYRDNGWPEDYDLWMRLRSAGHRQTKLADVLLEWRDAPHRASRLLPQYALERFADVKEHYLFETFLNPSPERPLAVWGAGPVGKRWLRRFARRGRGARYCIDVDPRKIGKRIHEAIVVSPETIGELGKPFVIVAVGALSRRRGAGAPFLAAREEIREQLVTAGFTELRDFVCVA